MIILAADTSTSTNTVAVCDGRRLLAETIVDCGRKHAEQLIATVDWALDQAGLSLGDIEMLAISVGPGSFTGLRVGVATWKGLAFSGGLGLVPVPTLAAMTRVVALSDGTVCPLLDARMKEVYGAVYHFSGGEREQVREARVCSVEDMVEGLAGDVVFLGEGSLIYEKRIAARIPGARFVGQSLCVPRAGAVALEALALLQQGICTEAEHVGPVYLRKSQPEEARRRVERSRL